VFPSLSFAHRRSPLGWVGFLFPTLKAPAQAYLATGSV